LIVAAIADVKRVGGILGHKLARSVRRASGFKSAGLDGDYASIAIPLNVIDAANDFAVVGNHFRTDGGLRELVSRSDAGKADSESENQGAQHLRFRAFGARPLSSGWTQT